MSSTTTDPTPTTDPQPNPPKPAPPAPATPQTSTDPAPTEVRLPDDHPLVKTLEAQKAEIRSLKDQRTDAEKVADRLAEVEQRAVQAEARVLRREVALDPTGDGKSAPLSKADAELLDTVTDEAAMRALAKRLAADAANQATHGNVVPGEGTNPRPQPDAKRTFLRELTGQG